MELLCQREKNSLWLLKHLPHYFPTILWQFIKYKWIMFTINLHTLAIIIIWHFREVSFFFFFSFLFFYIYYVVTFIYLFLAVLGLRFCARAFSSCGEWGPLFIAVRGPLTIAASLVAEHRLQTRRLSSCGSRARLLRGMWDPPRPGLEPVSPALAGRLSTTAPPGKPERLVFNASKNETSYLFLLNFILLVLTKHKLSGCFWNLVLLLH